MRKVKLLSFVVAISLTPLSMPTNALGFGNSVSPGVLNRPLEINLPLISETDDFHNIHASLANYKQHQSFGLQYPEWMPNLKFSIIESTNGAALKITSTKPIKEPVVNFVVAVNYQGLTLFKEVVLLLDPASVVEAKVINEKSALNTALQTSAKTLVIPQNPALKNSSSKSNTESSFIVKRGQSLWKIAQNWDVKGVNINQKMEAIYLSNTHAFLNADKNKLKQGSRLTLSSESLNLKTQIVQEAPVKITPTKIEIANTSIQVKAAQPLVLQQEVLELNKLIAKQEALNTSLRNQIKQLEERVLLQQKLANVQQTTPLVKKELQQPITTSLPPVAKIAATSPITSSAVPDLPKNKQIENSKPYEGSSNSIWMTTIWFFLALLVALLGSMFTSKRKAKVFAKKLETKLQNLAYNQERIKNQAPSLKELSIPKNLSTPLQIKYLNSAADFYLSCNRYDLAKELVNEGLTQFSGNTEVIRALNNIRKRIFSQLDIELQGGIVEKLDSIEANAVAQAQDKNDKNEEMTLEEIDTEWSRLWNKKAS